VFFLFLLQPLEPFISRKKRERTVSVIPI
jgi:hypothetical protein